MCGIAGIIGTNPLSEHAEWRVCGMVAAQRHRGPDGDATWTSPSERAVLGHTRLEVLDLSDAGAQPMTSPDGRYTIVFNGEVYNYRELRAELRAELGSAPYRSGTDTEVVLRAYERWGAKCLERFLGMFAFAIWDETERTFFAARDRFGVKPFHYALEGGDTLVFASEPKALHAGGVPAVRDDIAWATWLTYGLTDHGPRTYWKGISSLPAGHSLTFSNGRLNIQQWYDLPSLVQNEDTRPMDAVIEEYAALLEESVAFRFRSDVPVGINLSGGLDSSLLLDTVQRVQGADSDVMAFTFVTGDEAYDETPWVESMLNQTRYPSVLARLNPEDVPALAADVLAAQDGPSGGLPTLAYARLFETAAEHGVTVLLDGQGMDEQWAGYDYYAGALNGERAAIVQGSRSSALRADCLDPDFCALAEPPPAPKQYELADSSLKLRDLQLRDLLRTKIPRALRYNDRISMRSSRELREPFLDHRLVELALRQPLERKIKGEEQKVLLRQLAAKRLPADLRVTPKRPLQTPQREWLRGPLSAWAQSTIIDGALQSRHAWFKPAAVQAELDAFLAGKGDNSFFLWQWLEAGLLTAQTPARARGIPA